MDGLRKAIAIDFDGCLCTDAFPAIGEPNWPVIKRAQAGAPRDRNGKPAVPEGKTGKGCAA